jgi:hypothetical protein
MKECRYSSTILNLGNGQRRVVNFAPLPLYPRGNSSRYPLHRSSSEPQSQYRRYGMNEKLLRLPEINPPTPQSSDPQPSRYTDRPIPVPTVGA